MVVEVIYKCYKGEESKCYVKLKHILCFDTEGKRIYLKKSKVGFSWVSNVKNFDELLKSWKIYHDDNL